MIHLSDPACAWLPIIQDVGEYASRLKTSRMGKHRAVDLVGQIMKQTKGKAKLPWRCKNQLLQQELWNTKINRFDGYEFSMFIVAKRATARAEAPRLALKGGSGNNS